MPEPHVRLSLLSLFIGQAVFGLQVPDGFRVERAAEPGRVEFPMFATFDDKGRLFVTESSGLDLYAELSALTRKCRVRLLEDRDGDGLFERSQVFGDKLVYPMGLAWRDRKLYIADPPDLITIEDTDGDGTGEKRTVILSGFGHKDNGSLHGLLFGPDGWLYMTTGSPDGYKFKRADGSTLEGESGALIRCRPDGREVEVLARGFENLVEIVFTPEWEIVGTDNWFHRPEGGVRDALVHLLPGGLYPMRRDFGTPQLVTGEPLPAISLYPAVALSGLMRYEGSAFPEHMRGNLFSAQHNSRKVQRHVLIREGCTYDVEDHDFLTTTDPDFHPSDVLEAPDGSLLVLDTGSWYTQHCPTGRIRNSQSRGGIYRVIYNSPTPSLKAAPPSTAALARMGRLHATELVRLLESGEPHEQLAAAEALAQSGSGKESLGLWNALGRNPGRMLEHAIIYALSRHTDSNEIRARVMDSRPPVQAAALLLQRGLTNAATSTQQILQRYNLVAANGEIPTNAPQMLAEWEPLLASGTALRGRVLFFSPRTACATCHAIAGQGGKVGPDLTRVGAIRSGRDILESILFPSSTFAQGYQSVIVSTSDGEDLHGLTAGETADGILLRDTGTETLIRKEQIRDIKPSTVSLMPSGLEQAMSRDEFADLLAFLQSLK